MVLNDGKSRLTPFFKKNLLMNAILFPGQGSQKVGMGVELAGLAEREGPLGGQRGDAEQARHPTRLGAVAE